MYASTKLSGTQDSENNPHILSTLGFYLRNHGEMESWKEGFKADQKGLLFMKVKFKRINRINRIELEKKVPIERQESQALKHQHFK